MKTNIAPGLRFSILDREFKKKLEETFSQSDGSTSRKQHECDLTGREK
jgi:hypothetical protein